MEEEVPLTRGLFNTRYAFRESHDTGMAILNSLGLSHYDLFLEVRIERRGLYVGGVSMHAASCHEGEDSLECAELNNWGEYV
jgi:hypothetical protein